MNINKKVIVISSFLLFLLGLFLARKEYSQIISIRTYKYLISALLIIQLIIVLTKNNKNKVVIYVGKNSLIILGFHRIILKLLEEYKIDNFLKKYNIDGDFSAILISLGCIFGICIVYEIYKAVYKTIKKTFFEKSIPKKVLLLNE